MDRAEGRREGRLEQPSWPEEAARLSLLPSRLPPPASSYITPSGILLRFDELLRRHGGRAQIAGDSVEGRPLWAFRFGPEGPGGVLLLSLLHAFEWIGPLALLAVAEELLRHGHRGPLTCLPIANPDGAARATEIAAGARFRFARGNARGVDLNRNFPPFHRRSGIWSAMPWYRPGPGGGSEPETSAIVRLARDARPAVALSFHSFGRWFFYPPAHRARPWPQTARHRDLIEAAGGTKGIGYRAGQLGRWSLWFRAHGSEIDFLSDQAGAIAYLIEVSRGGIGRWGARRLAVPFFWYNPRHPEREIEPLRGFCARLVRAATA